MGGLQVLSLNTRERVNYDFSLIRSDEMLMRAFVIAVSDTGVDKLRCLCWLVNDVKVPKAWLNSAKTRWGTVQ